MRTHRLSAAYGVIIASGGAERLLVCGSRRRGKWALRPACAGPCRLPTPAAAAFTSGGDGFGPLRGRNPRRKDHMAKRVVGKIGLALPAGKATPAPPVGPALGPYSLNIMDFCKQYNDRTKAQEGFIIPVEITVFEDRTFTFITKTPPASFLIKRALGLESGSKEPNRNKVGKLTAGASSRDRRGQEARPQRERRSGRDEDHRRHRALDGRGGRELMRKHGKRYRTSPRRSTRRRCTIPSKRRRW